MQGCCTPLDETISPYAGGLETSIEDFCTDYYWLFQEYWRGLGIVRGTVLKAPSRYNCHWLQDWARGYVRYVLCREFTG